jgi:ribonucleoside-diphosphate reductase alpha chain
LISINLKNFVKESFTSDAEFDFEKFADVVRVSMRLSDDLVELETEKLQNIIEVSDTQDEMEMWSKLLQACDDGRRTGLGTHGLADALACLRLAYDSTEAIKVTEKIYKTLKEEAYRESVVLGRERGAFPVFDWEKEKDNAFIKTLPADIQMLLQEYGRRNISILTNAPTGSVSILSQTSSGLEPVFRNSYIRRRKMDHSDADTEADFVDDVGDRWKEFKVYHHNVREYLAATGRKTPPKYFVESDQIDWKKRIEIQSVIQQHIDHAISSTINLPRGTDPEVVGELYLDAWRSGLKGVTVYVDGSRSGVLLAESESTDFPQHESPRRPEILDCDIHHTTIQGEKWTILVGLMEGKPYEIMGGEANMIEIPKRYTKGELTKHNFKTKNNRYDLTFGFNGDTITIKDMVKAFDNPNNSTFTRMISLGLRHGAKVRFMVEQLQKDKDSDMFSFARCIARILKNYIQDGEIPSDKGCSSCGNDSLVYQDGCVTCASCGYAKCG